MFYNRFLEILLSWNHLALFIIYLSLSIFQALPILKCITTPK